MQIITFLIVAYVVIKMLCEYESPDQKIRRMDNDPNCTLKSDKWKREHGLL
jgi:hypothetical protein